VKNAGDQDDDDDGCVRRSVYLWNICILGYLDEVVVQKGLSLFIFH
jgi:hypothetical protein